MKNGRSLRRLRELWRRSAKRLIDSPELLACPALKPVLARYQLALEGVNDPESARARLGLKGSLFRKPF